jgi:hypothetical protein
MSYSMPARAVPATRDILAFASAALLLVGAMLFGGGPRGVGDAVVHVAMLPCLALGLWRWEWASATRWERAFFAWWCCALALVIAQLMPLPPALLALMPQRAGVLADLAKAGVAPEWRPMTLDVWSTVRAGLALVTFGAIWLLARTFDAREQRRLLILALGVGVGLAFFGFAQAASGTHAVRFYQFHHPIGAIATFANRNHFAAFLAMLLPIALAFAAQAQRARDPQRATMAFATAAVLWFAAALTFSRAGFLLASFSLIVAAGWLWWPRGGEGRRWIVPMLVFGIAMLAAGHYAWDGFMHRLEQDPLDDLRWQYLRNGMAAVHAYLPWGSGLGTFPWVYAPMEPLAEMGPTFAERAHNDVLQVAIEAGLPGLALLLGFTALVFIKATRNFLIGRKQPNHHDPIRGAIVIALAVPLLHAWVDYPLRTMTVSVMAGLLLSIRGTERQASF